MTQDPIKYISRKTGEFYEVTASRITVLVSLLVFVLSFYASDRYARIEDRFDATTSNNCSIKSDGIKGMFVEAHLCISIVYFLSFASIIFGMYKLDRARQYEPIPNS